MSRPAYACIAHPGLGIQDAAGPCRQCGAPMAELRGRATSRKAEREAKGHSFTRLDRYLIESVYPAVYAGRLDPQDAANSLATTLARILAAQPDDIVERYIAALRAVVALTRAEFHKGGAKAPLRRK